MKLTDRSCVCNDLTSFEYEVYAMTGNGSYLKLQKLARKNREITLGELIFGGFKPFGTTVRRTAAALRQPVRRAHLFGWLVK